MTISLRGRVCCPKLYARLVWQELFDIYRTSGGDLERMDSMLCDLYSLTRAFERSQESNASFLLYWWFGKNGYTDMQPLPELNEYSYKIDYNINKHEVTVAINKAA